MDEPFDTDPELAAIHPSTADENLGYIPGPVAQMRSTPRLESWLKQEVQRYSTSAPPLLVNAVPASILPVFWSMRRFLLIRYSDVLGISGTGVIAIGTHYQGRVSEHVHLMWLTGQTAPEAWFTTESYPSMAKLEAIKCHPSGGTTRIIWLDPPRDEEPADPTTRHNDHEE